MKAIALASLLFSLVACQSKAKEEVVTAPPAPPAEASQPMTGFALDLDRICNVEDLSGALELPSGDRALHTAIWLAKTIETQEARDFLAELTKLEADARIQLLEVKLAEYKITSCEILHTWGGAE